MGGIIKARLIGPFIKKQKIKKELIVIGHLGILEPFHEVLLSQCELFPGARE